MANASKIAGLMVAVTIAAVLFTPIATTIGDNTGDQSVVNETVTAQAGDYVDLNGYAVESGSETVYYQNGSDWETAASGTDYEMNYSAGSVQALSSGNIADGSDVRVTYTWQATSDTTSTVMTMIPMFVGLLILGTIAARIQDAM